VNLRRRDADAARIHHGLRHVGDEALDLRRGRILDLGSAAEQHRVAEAGDLQEGHGRLLIVRVELFDRARCARGLPAQDDFVLTQRSWKRGGAPSLSFLVVFHPLSVRRLSRVQVVVRDNNIDQALKALKKKLQREGVFREMKLRRHYEKPSERRAREKAEAIRRTRKLMRKRMEREGY
jgi:small subunit ribosomal protein S21